MIKNFVRRIREVVILNDEKYKWLSSQYNKLDKSELVDYAVDARDRLESVSNVLVEYKGNSLTAQNALRAVDECIKNRIDIDKAVLDKVAHK